MFWWITRDWLAMNPDDLDPSKDDFTAHLARVKKWATVAGVVGALAGIGFSVAYLMRTEKPNIRGVIVSGRPN